VARTRCAASAEHATPAAPRTPRAAGGPAAVLALQRAAGNQAVCRLLDSRGHLQRCKKKGGKGGGAGSAEQSKVKAATNQREVNFAAVTDFAQTAMRNILINGNDARYLRPAKDGRKAGAHSTDPETGLPKAQGVGVREYHATPSNESIRIVVRTVGTDKRVYYDWKHTAGTYTYHRVKDPPFPAAPAPAPAPAAAVVPAAVVPAAAALPAVQAPAPVPDRWDDD
jgi:hypothetical protein